MNESYTFEIGAEVKAARRAVEELIDETKKGLGSINMNTAVSAIKDGFDIARRALEPVIRLIGESIGESLEAEKANKALANSMRLVGDFSERAMQQQRDLANELARTTQFSDDQVLAAAALAKQYGLTNRETEDLLRVGTDLAALTGDDLNTSVEKLAKTYNGFISRELKQLRPELRQLTEEQLAAGEAVRILGERVAGSAERLNTGFGAAVNRATKANNEFKEALGDTITKAKENSAIIEGYAASVEFLTANMDVLVKTTKDFLVATLNLGPAKAGVDILAAAYRALRGETELTLDTIEDIRLKASQAFGEKQVEERIKRERAANVAAEKAITEFNGIRLDLEKRGLTEIEAINKEASRRIQIVRAAAGAGYPEAVKKQEQFIAGIRIDAAQRVAKIQAELDKKVLDSRLEIENLVRGKLEEVTNAPLSGLITFVVKGQEELDNTRAKIDQVMKSIRSDPNLADGIKKQLLQGAEAMKVKLSEGFSRNVAIGLASSILNAVKKGAAGAAEAVASIVGGIVDVYFPGLGKIVSQFIEFFAQGPEAVRKMVTDFQMAVPQVVENILTAIPAFIEQVIQNVPKVIEKIISMIPRIIVAFIKAIPAITNAFVNSIPEIIQAFIRGVPQIITELVRSVPEIVKAFIDAFFNLLKQDGGTGGISNIIGGGGGGLLGSITGGIGDIIGGVGDFFGGFWAHGGTLPDSPGLRGDKIPIMADAGETFLSRDLTNRLAAALDGGAMAAGGPTTVILKVGEQELARTILNLNRGGFRTA